MQKIQTLVVVLDGVSFLEDEPCFTLLKERSLREGHYSGILESYNHTIPSFTSMLSGFPTQTVRFGFDQVLHRREKQWSGQDSHTEGRWLYDVLEDKKQVYFNIPIHTYAPQINGAFVSGFLSNPEEQIYPENKYSLEELGFNFNYLDPDWMIEHGKKLSENRKKAALHIMQDVKPELGFVVFTEPDRIRHMRYNAKYAEVFSEKGINFDEFTKDFLIELDRQVDDFINQFDYDHLIICSDHGFSKTSNNHYHYGFYIAHSKKSQQKLNYYRHVQDVYGSILRTFGKDKHYLFPGIPWFLHDEPIRKS